MSTILITFLIFAGTTSTFVTNYWKNEKEEIFIENAHYVSNLVANNSYVEDNNIVWINGDAVKIFMDTLSSSMNIDIFVTDTKGNLIISSIYNKKEFAGGGIPQEIVEKVSRERYSETNNLEGVYKSEQYIIGEAVYANYGGKKTIIGAVFTSMNPRFLEYFKKDILKVFLVTFLVTILVSFIMVRKLSYNMVRPLKQMSEAAASMAGGDFSKRVAVDGNDEIADLGNSFNNMAESLYMSESVKKNFIANVSHELKTPMTTITGFIDGILDGVIKEKDRVKYLKIVSLEIRRLSRLVKSMLELSRIDTENVKMNFSSVDLFDEFIEVLLQFEDKINKKNISVKGIKECGHIIINADRDMIHQVIYNLVENAVKFTENRGYINVELLKDSNTCTFIVENSGEEIPSKEIKFIFDRFYKTDKSRSKDKTGIGLGLYIVKKIVALHGGSIETWSENKITKFTVKLPIKIREKNNKI